jgi:hypothetical protein
MGWNMKLEILQDKILIWETGRQKNDIIFDSIKDLSNYNRRNLANYELFLRESQQEEIANKIISYLGKIIRARDCDDMLIPDGNYQINTSLDDLQRTINRYIKEDGLNLDPDFQRSHVWNMEQRIAYVEFLLKGGKSNPIYFNHEGWMKSFNGEFVIVDGKQRLTSILMFLNNEFPVFKDKDGESIGYYAKEFDMIPNNIVFIINDLPNRKSVLNWYLQMNEGNVAHTETELNKVRNMIKEL